MLHTPILSEDEFFSLSHEDQKKHLISYGTLAPNSHNTQPWAFKIDTDTNAIFVYLDRSRVLPASDETGRQAVTSIGCAITNICQASTAYRLKHTVQTMISKDEDVTTTKKDAADRYVHLATISYSDDASTTKNIDEPASLLQSMKKRKVIRADYDRQKELPEAFTKELHQIQKQYTKHDLMVHVITDPVRRQGIAEFQGQADGYVINSKKFSRELGEWLLPNDTTSQLGMPGNGFGLHDDQANRLHKALLGEQALEPEDGLRFALGGKRGIETSPLIACISAKEDSPTTWLHTGKMLEEILLLATKYNLASAIHAGIVEVKLVNKLFAMSLGTTRRIFALCRIGFLKNEEDGKRPHPPRLPLDEVLI